MMLPQLIGVQQLSIHQIPQVKYPDQKKMRQQFADMVQLRVLIVNDFISFIDGVLIPAKCTDERAGKNAFY